ncbi:MAG: hypothetical protein IJN02_09725 [Bacteroidales bacterium]|nr:hypothetical protein [Bacteroidales bacterium]
MKTIVKSFILIAAAAVGFTACQKEIQEEVPVNKGTVQVTFVAGSPETKTTVDTSSDEAPVFSWEENETFAVLEQTEELAAATQVAYEKVDEKAQIKATFNTNAGQSSYDYVTIYPASGYVSAESIGAATLSLPAVQTMAESSYDPAADLMVSEVVTTTVQPTEAQMVRFTRMAAVVKMTLKNFTPEDGDEVEQVIFTAEGKNLAGTVTADLATPHEFAVAEGVDNVTVNTTSSSDVYFTVLPAILEAGDAYTVTVITNKKLYIKKGVIPEEKSLAFEAGMVTRLGVNMDGIAASEKWVLVRDASTLAEGDIVTIAASDLNYVLGCYFDSNYPYASYTTDIIKSGDYLYHPIVADKSQYKYMAQSLILAKRDADKVAFDFYNGVDYEGDTKTGYLTNLITNNYLRLSSYPTDNTLLYVTIDGESGVATISATDSEFNNKLLKYRAYNNGTSTSYRRFVFVSSPTSEHHDVCIYKLLGAKGVVPTAGAVVTVPDADEPVVVPVEGVAEETVFEDVKFTYVGDWNISVSDNAEWLTLDYADGVLKYLADANPGVVRYAEVTIKATHDGEADKTWTFNVVQKGAPVKVTVAEFIEMEKDENVEYEVTGILQSKASSASYSTYVVDAEGNKATFKYIDMADGSDFYNNADVAANDVVTIIASVATKGTGGSSSAHAICKGYYNLSATVENDLVDYTGGSVEISLNKSGTLNPAGNITCTADANFAELEYTTNAYEAVVTLPANDGAPRQVIVTFTDGYARTSVAIVQGADKAKGNTWELVTDASTLAEGDQVIIAAKDYDVAMSTTISSERRSAVAVTKLGSYYLTPALGAQTLVLANGSAEDTFAFYDGGDNKGFLVSTSTSYELNNQTYIDANASFTVSIADGVATIGNKTGDYSSNKMYYREGSSYNYFYSGTTAKQAICLYRLAGVKGTIPVIPADVTVPSSSVVVPEEGAVAATAINDIEFNYVGDWNISATSEAEWISFAFDKANSKLTYTAAANEGTVRETSATITATMEGQEPLTWNFNVLQKGAPTEITCDELNDKEQNVNVSYKLTGRIVSMAMGSSGTFMLDDGTGRQAEIRYLYTDAGDAVYGNDEIGLMVGDVVTVTTVVYTKGKGGHSSYHSTYKGHYRLTATADKDLIDYEGGTATITLATSGNLVPAGEIIKGAMAEAYDFVTFDYTENAATATATFAANNGASRGAEFNFTFGLASVTVAVGQQNNPAVKVGWFLVTNVNELAPGDMVIIAAKSPDETLDYAFAKPTSSTATTFKGTAITLQGNSISDVTGIEQFTLESGLADYPGTFAFKGSTYNKYIYVSSGYLRTNTTLNQAGSWAVAIDSEGKVSLVSQTTNSKNTMMFNYVSSNQTFSVYTSSTTGKGAIYLYKYYE